MNVVAHEFIPGELEDPLALNQEPNVWDYNCGGFALGVKEWYIPEEYYSMQHGKGNTKRDMEKLVATILNEFAHLRQVPTPRVRKSKTVIGFRLATATWERERYGDFHFIVRINGEWYEKMAGDPITRFKQKPTGVWHYYSRDYDLPIAWFVDTRTEERT